MLNLLWMVVLACRLGTAPVGLPVVGQPAPAISSVALGGAPFSLSALRGTPVVLVFWASWCGPCREEVPEIAALVQQYGETVHVVSLNAGESPPVAADAAERWGIDWLVVFDPDGQIQANYHVNAIPLVVILDREGTIRYRDFTLPEDLSPFMD
ncbi:MAG: TlpA disulfide reductase family protein [Myxococcota bacterium]